MNNKISVFQNLVRVTKIKYDEPGRVCFCKWRRSFGCPNRTYSCPLGIIDAIMKHDVWPFSE